MSIYNEFVNGFMRNEDTGFMIKLALISVSSSIIKNPEYRILLSESLLRRKNTDHLGLYKNLFLLTELKLIPDNVEIIFSKLCEHCELVYPLQFMRSLSKYLESSTVIPTPSNMIENLTMKPTTQLILFKEPLFMLSTVPTAFNCLTQLMKLLTITLEGDTKNEIDEFVAYARKQKGKNDKYFNLLFFE